MKLYNQQPYNVCNYQEHRKYSEGSSYAGHKILLSLCHKLVSHSTNFLKTTLKS